MAYIEIIQPEQSTGRLQEIYAQIKEKRGKIAEVHKIQSLNPESIVNHMDLYMTIMFGKSPLKRYQREMMAVIVSKNNDCDYCQQHHGTALLHFWKDQQKIDQLKQDYHALGLDPADQQLCEYARELTVNPGGIKEEDHIQKLREAGLDDTAILDASLVIAYFNFVNRMVLGLGVHLEQDNGRGFYYD